MSKFWGPNPWQWLWLTIHYYIMAPHSSTLAWRIPWTEEPGGLQSMGWLKSQTRLSDFTFTFHFHALEKAMATHSSVVAWGIPGTGEPGGLPSMGSHRVRHDWSDLAAALYTWEFLRAGFKYFTTHKFVIMWGNESVNKPYVGIHFAILNVSSYYIQLKVTYCYMSIISQ